MGHVGAIKQRAQEHESKMMEEYNRGVIALLGSSFVTLSSYYYVLFGLIFSPQQRH